MKTRGLPRATARSGAVQVTIVRFRFRHRVRHAECGLLSEHAFLGDFDPEHVFWRSGSADRFSSYRVQTSRLVVRTSFPSSADPAAVNPRSVTSRVCAYISVTRISSGPNGSGFAFSIARRANHVRTTRMAITIRKFSMWGPRTVICLTPAVSCGARWRGSCASTTRDSGDRQLDGHVRRHASEPVACAENLHSSCLHPHIGFLHGTSPNVPHHTSVSLDEQPLGS